MDVFHGSDLATLIPDTQVVVGVTGIPRAALKDVRLTDGTLLMPVYDDSVQGRLTSRASLLMCVGWVQGVVHISQTSIHFVSLYKPLRFGLDLSRT